MKHSSLLAAAVISLSLAAPALAQEGGQGAKVLGTVSSGNTDIVFEAANSSDLPMKKLQAWSEFAAGHPNVAHELGRNPALLGNPAYTRKHPALAKLFQDNPGLKESLQADPGNYVLGAGVARNSRND